MKKQIILCCSILLITFFYDAKSQGFLQAHQGRIIDSNSGEEVLWRGMGLGGWMLQEGYMLETGGPQFQIQRRITELIGEDKKNEFYDAWLDNHMQEIDVDSLSSWGFNMIRLPMHYNLFTPPIEEETNGEITWLNKGFELTDNLLQWCKTHNVYLILDLHATPGGQGENADINDYDPTKPSLWESEANKAKMIALWRKLAERYADEPMIAAYDIINEPNWGFQDHAGDPNGCSESENTELWDLQKDVTEAIREVDQNHIVIIEGNCWGNNYTGLPELWDDNMVVSYHKYWNANDVGAIQGMLDMRNDRNVPIWLGETGENSNTWFTNAVQLFEENDMGWSWWPLKKTGGNNPLQIHKGEGYQQVIDYWNGAAEAPSETEAYEGLMQFAENTKLENCEYRKDVVDALIRQPHTNETKPFKLHDLKAGGNLLIYAVDYDLGKNGYAYYDVDASNTSGTSGGASWNSGGQYRNDGVDIEGCSDELTNGYNVGWTMPEEWLQYTINVEEEGSYHVSFRVASPSGLGKVMLYANDVKVSETITMPNTGDYQAWSTITVEGIHLNQGEQKLKLLIEEGDFNFNYIEIEGPFDVTEQPKILEKKAINQKKRIGLIFNQSFVEMPEAHGFTATVNGESAEIESVELGEEAHQVVNIYMAEEIHYGDEILISYNGTNLQTTEGVTLAAITDLPIDIFLDGDRLPLAVPGQIEVEDYFVNSGFEWEEAEDEGGGLNLSYTDAGDYLDFAVNVEEEGYYEVEYRVSSQDEGGTVALFTLNEEDQETEISRVSFEKTDDWQAWVTVNGSVADLSQGFQRIRLKAITSLFNVNWIRLNYIGASLPTGVEDNIALNYTVYPNPADGAVNVRFANSVEDKQISLRDHSGKVLFTQEVPQGREQIEIKESLAAGLYFITVTDADESYTQKIIIR